MSLDRSRVPIVVGPELPGPVPRLNGLMDGFRPLGAVLGELPPTDRRAAEELIAEKAEAGRIVWRDKWSPLRWCDACNLPLLQGRCDRCGTSASPSIELKFPCNPRPVIPHDEHMFRAVGLPWPVGHSTVINGYQRPGRRGWELINSGRKVGEIISSVGTDEMSFAPSDARWEETFDADGTGAPGIEDVVAANATRLETIEKEAVGFIREWCERWRFTIPIVTFSGGKDSAVLLHLCSLTDVRMRLLQIDTGIDPVGNEGYSDRLLSRYENFRVMRTRNGDIFWRAMRKLGPPAHDFQWCRIVLKNSAPYRSSGSRTIALLKWLEPLVKFRGIIIDGPRRREEPWRIALERVVRIPDAPIETHTIRPMLDFTDLDIWMQMHRFGLPLNPTYTEEKQRRLVCLFCPDKDRYELDVTRKRCPRRWDRFEEELERWREAFGFPEEWVSEDLWVRNEPASDYVRELGIVPRVEMIAERLNSCTHLGGTRREKDAYRVEGRIDAEFELPPLADWLRPFGAVRFSDGKHIASVQGPMGRLELAADGGLRILAASRGEVEQLRKMAADWIASYLNCIGCGTCRSAIRHIRLRGGRATMRRRCRECTEALREAIWLCPVNATGVRRCLSRSQNS